MEKKTHLLKPIALWVIIGGLLSLSTAFMAAFYFDAVGTVIGFLLLLLMVFFAAYEMGAFRSIWIAQVGEWSSILRVFGAMIPIRLLFIVLLLGTDTSRMGGDDKGLLELFLLANGLALVIELTSFAFIYRKKEVFMPSKEEVEEVMKRIHTAGVRSLSECPKCKDLIEPEWCCCPGCGTLLPKFCVKCNAEINSVQSSCSRCGAVVARSIAVVNMIETLKGTAELPASSETKSVRYARYAEALLKGGQLDDAIDSYRKAIEHTQFVRKKTNFMVKMATVYQNSGKHDEALKMLDAAMALDPEDWAGAKGKRDEIMSGSSSGCMVCAPTA